MSPTLTTLAAAMSLALLAGGVRGYCGFGFAMLLALGLILFMPPIQAVPLALLLDLATSLGLWRRALRHADWPCLRPLLLGMALATGLGVWLLASVPAAPMRIVVALLAMSGAVALLCQRNVASPGRAAQTRGVVLGAGGLSGLCMTLASSGGPPLMLYLLYRRMPPLAMRATAIIFFVASSSASLLGLGLAGALHVSTWHWAAWLLLPALLGNVLGQWRFESAPPRSLKSSVAPLLIALSLWVLIREALA
ncbi:sulfite exporter TauE/SafE family protein [Chromohalobacter moromii]|uniref:Probable membrane transporter protein n=1 Tax=Chromohalobacter moromii TaxID=2860329 RepID=A0A9X3AXH1_9GAMM|nr:sulfite exporter TauE/SafE family protein [Chromohalobacter moromii]MCT8505452.1 sulfite exporter TauE/SafE family protein [Chromohalobacter moromii]